MWDQTRPGGSLAVGVARRSTDAWVPEHPAVWAALLRSMDKDGGGKLEMTGPNEHRILRACPMAAR